MSEMQLRDYGAVNAAMKSLTSESKTTYAAPRSHSNDTMLYLTRIELHLDYHTSTDDASFPHGSRQVTTAVADFQLLWHVAYARILSSPYP